MFEVIELGGQPFLVPTGADESQRRAAFFKKIMVQPKYAEFRPSELEELLEEQRALIEKAEKTKALMFPTPAPNQPAKTANTATTLTANTTSTQTANSNNLDNLDKLELKSFPTKDTLPSWMSKEDREILLRAEEYALLEALGFNSRLMVSLAENLAEFFDSLPSCSTDTTMMLKKECEKAYYVLWSVQFALQNAKATEINAGRAKQIAPLQAAIDGSIVDALDGAHKTPRNMDPVDIYALFTRSQNHASIVDLTKTSPTASANGTGGPTLLPKPGPSKAAIKAFFKPLTQKDVEILRLFRRTL